ncbi:MAG: hypothetical protein RIE59_02470 [Imperialibacter sp.]
MRKSQNSGYNDWIYIVDPEYSQNPEHYVRAFMIIQEDLLKLFQSIEPSDTNKNTYSFRTHELLMRICIEVEANFKAILRENTYTPKDKKGKPRLEKDWTMNDYRLLNKTHRLSDFRIEFPIWSGNDKIRQPFLPWNGNGSIDWYNVYNRSKHDRIGSFQEANFDTLLDSFAGLAALLASQFNTQDFQPGADLMAFHGANYGIGNYLIIHFPETWLEDEIYEFNWEDIKDKPDRFQKIDYNNIKY